MICVPLGFGGELVEATFLARPNRFLVEARLGDALVEAHLADRGRLTETLVPGARLLLARRPGLGRRTAYQAVAAYRDSVWRERSALDAEHVPQGAGSPPLVSLDTHLPNRLILAALRAGALPRFAGYARVRPEVRIGASRFDFLLEGEAGRCVLEVKSAGHLASDTALFPDAPTGRGLRHLAELAELARGGTRAAVLFAAQGQAHAVAMNTAVDPAFAAGLARAAAAGVEVCAYACPLSRAGIVLGEEVPVRMSLS
ncbi:MAG TPA: DNA/RNA nuclease SfsA [Roseiflexaceae bacterium]|nr:DNA/RNA nuclease SfsA [Roseiflexaceae bacterium]